MNYSTPGSTYYYDRQSPNKQSPLKDQSQYDDEEVPATMNSALRNLNMGPTVSDHEMQINGILKNLKNKLFETENFISQKENEKAGIIDDINVLTQRLKSLQKSIAKKKQVYENYDKILNDSENALTKVTESMKTLLTVVKKENQSMTKLNLSSKNF